MGGEALLLKPGEPAETLGSVAVHACKESRCFHSRLCQVFRATFSCLEVRCLIRRGVEGGAGGQCGTFQRQKLQL